MLDAKFITPAEALSHPTLFREFKGRDAVKATLQITGLGLYRAFLNGQRVGEDWLSPGFNDYDAYLRFQTYDVTGLIREDNRLEVTLGDGWYKGRFGLDGGVENTWGERYLLCARLTLGLADGREEVIGTDESWQAVRSPVTFSNIYDGEARDDTAEAGPPVPCETVETGYSLMPDFSPTVRHKLTLTPVLITSPKGESILDFGQNMTGVVRFRSRLKKGERLRMLLGEVLQDGCFYQGNLRSAKAEYTYVSDGVDKDVEPYFTFYGFRYALVEGLGEVDPADYSGLVLYSDLRGTLSAETDSPLLNRLMENALWGQRGNFVDVPTDCPQRDERLGWTADTQVFVNTACFQMDCKDFYRTFMRDMREDQTRYYNGDIPMFSPSLKGRAGPGGAAWADAGTIVPWNVYWAYGDRELLSENWPMMRDFAEAMIRKDEAHGGRHVIDTGFIFGDWLALDGMDEQAVKGGTDDSFIMTAYYCHSLRLASLAALELGHGEEAKRYIRLSQAVREAFLDEFFAPGGRLAVDTQTGYVLALFTGLYRDREKLLAGLRNRLKKDAFRIKTGFVGTPLMLPVLFDNGMADEAFRMLYNEKYPGWLYCVKLGATTIWERWNSLLPDGRISGTGMNSLNHYAYGSVCEAIYSRIAGLRPALPGWGRALIAPHLNWRMKHIRVAFHSPAGLYLSAWKVNEDGSVTVEAEVPEGASATLVLPAHPEGLRRDIGPGKHSYIYQPSHSLLYPYSAASRGADLMASPGAREVLQKLMPDLFARLSGDNSFFLQERVCDAAGVPPFVKGEGLAELDAALRKVRAE